MKAPLVPKSTGATSVLPSGLRIETRVLQQEDVPIVTFVRRKQIGRASGRVKVSDAFWPETVVVKVTGAPPGVIVPVMSAGTSLSVSVALPVSAFCGSTKIV